MCYFSLGKRGDFVVKATLEDAIALAVRLHKGQVDKAGEPYILHVLRVMMDPILETKEEKKVGALHDTKEDCGVTDEDLREWGYSEPVIEALRYLTKLP